MSKPGALARSVACDELGLDPVHVGAGHLAWHAAVGKIGFGRGRQHLPAALLQRTVHPVPHQLRRTLAAGMPELQADLRRRLRMHEIDDAPPPGLVLVVPQPGAAMRDAGVGPNAGHLGEEEAGPADGARAVMHEVPIGRHPLFGRIHAHRRHHDPVRYLHLAQPERLEHRDGRTLYLHLETAVADLAGESAVDIVDKGRGAQAQIVVGDRFGSGHHPEGELDGIEVPKAVDMLEPDERDVGGHAGFSRPPRAGRFHSARAPPRPKRRPGRPRTARWRPPWRAWCRSRWRNAPSPWHRR
jgi:hypothetical protein